MCNCMLLIVMSYRQLRALTTGSEDMRSWPVLSPEMPSLWLNEFAQVGFCSWAALGKIADSGSSYPHSFDLDARPSSAPGAFGKDIAWPGFGHGLYQVCFFAVLITPQAGAETVQHLCWDVNQFACAQNSLIGRRLLGARGQIRQDGLQCHAPNMKHNPLN